MTIQAYPPMSLDVPTVGERPAGVALPIRCPRLQALRLLGWLRVAAPLTQGLTLFVVTSYFDVQVPLQAVAVVLALEVLVAALTLWRLRHDPPVSEPELFAQAQLDVLLYGAMLFLTGGTTNPFGPLFVLPMVIVSPAMRPRWVWAMALTSIAFYVALRNYHVALLHPDGHTQVYSLHEDGMVVNYLITAALLAFFVNRMQEARRRNERLLTDARDAQVRNESAAAIGALAAGYAHELSSPLATIAIVATELRRQCPAGSPMAQDLALVTEQVAECKRILSKFSDAGGERRAESAAAVRVDRFLNLVIERSRALHPGATIAATLNGTSPAPTIASEVTLGQAMMDVITHAARVSPDAVQVTCWWSREELGIEVRDRGPGFDAEWLTRLHRGEVPPVAGDGSDMDLLRAAATLERLGGRLEAVNLRPDGARTVIRVPMRKILIEAGPPVADGSTDR